MPTLRHIAREGRTYVIGVTSCISAADLPAGLPGRAGLYGDSDDWLSRGNTVIVGPEGEILAGPLTGEAYETRSARNEPAAAAGVLVDAYLLGRERVRVYDGSWAEWGRMPEAPVEQA